MIGYVGWNTLAAPWAVDGLIHGRFEWGDVPEFRGHAPRTTRAEAWVWLDLATTPGLDPFAALESIGIYPDRQLPRSAAARLAELGKLALVALVTDAPPLAVATAATGAVVEVSHGRLSTDLGEVSDETERLIGVARGEVIEEARP